MSAQTNAAATAPEFPDAFIRGVGMSVWQNSSDGGTGLGVENCACPSNWGAYAQKKNYFGEAKLVDAWTKSNDFWNLWVFWLNALHAFMQCQRAMQPMGHVFSMGPSSRWAMRARVGTWSMGKQPIGHVGNVAT
eukprot:359332-Chlamydomonas_euryale.AAC.4